MISGKGHFEAVPLSWSGELSPIWCRFAATYLLWWFPEAMPCGSGKRCNRITDYLSPAREICTLEAVCLLTISLRTTTKMRSYLIHRCACCSPTELYIIQTKRSIDRTQSQQAIVWVPGNYPAASYVQWILGPP